MKNIYQLIQFGTERIKKFILLSEDLKKQQNKNNGALYHSENINFFSFKDKKFLNKENNSEQQLLVNALNFTLELIPLIIFQEYEILKLQNFKQVKNNNNLYELLYLGLKEKFLEYIETKPIIEAFYETNRITKNQYLTLINHCYLEDKEYEEKND